MTQERARRIFWTVAISYGILWTLLPCWGEYNYRFDVIEMFFIGREGVVSTFKHPALNSAVLEVVYQLLGRSEIAAFLLAQLCFLATAWSVWRLGREFLSPEGALAGSLCFYGYWSFFYKSLYYNHNVVLMPAWGLTVLFAYLALKNGRYRYWIALGIAIGLGVQCKYTLLTLVLAILFFMTASRRTRRFWLTPGPYLTTILSLLIALPQIHWIFVSDFSCLGFPDAEYGIKETLVNRLYSLFNDALSVIPFLGSSFVVMLVPLFGLRWRLRTLNESERHARNFLLAVGCIPWLVMTFSAVYEAIPMEYANFFQLFIFLGPFFLLIFKPSDRSSKAVVTVESEKTARDRLRYRRFLIGFSVVMLVYLVGYSVHLLNTYCWSQRTVFYAFPGRELAETAEKIWHERYSKPLPYAVGGWWHAGNVSIYGKDRASVHCSNNAFTLDPDYPLSNWSTDQDVLKHGGLVFWGIDSKSTEDDREKRAVEILKERFPSAEVLAPISLAAKSRHGKAFRIGIALIPPNPEIRAEPFQPAPWRFFHPAKRR